MWLLVLSLGPPAFTHAAGPDLVMTAVTTPTPNVPMGGSVAVTTTVRNQGTAAAGFFSVGIYLSTDATVTTADTLLAIHYVPGLAVGASATATTAVTLPLTLTPGTYALGAIADYTKTQSETDETNNTRAGPAIVVVQGVDLVMTAVSTPSPTVPLGQRFDVTITVTNQGTTGTTSPFSVGIYVSRDPVVTTADILVATHYVAGLAAGASHTATIPAMMPVVPFVSYYLGALADVDNTQVETDETNNAMPGPLLVTVRAFDLVMTAVRASTTTLPIGGSVTITDTVKNQGTSSVSGAFYVGVYLSTDATITTTDTLLLYRTVDALAVGASHTATTTVTVPLTLAPGTYVLGAIADYAAAPTEPNNTLVGATVVAVRDVDLVLTEVSAAVTTAPVGGSFAMTTTVKNQGTTRATALYRVGLYLSTDATITPSDTLLDTYGVPYWQPLAGESVSNTLTVTIPTNLPPGTYHLGAIVDLDNAQPESNETNNTRAGASLLIGRPDLTLTEVSTTATNVPVGGSIPCTITVQNQGNAPTLASPLTVGVYLSTDATITTADTRLTTLALAALAAGERTTITATMGVPTTLPPGTYYLGAIADDGNTQPESNETNNARTGTPIVVGRPDLVVTAVHTAVTQVSLGGNLLVSATVQNQGNAAMFGGFALAGLYLSTDTTITTADTLVAVSGVPALTAGASHTLTFTVTVPSTLPPGP